MPSEDDHGPELRDIQFINASQGWAVGPQGFVLATANGGQSWQRQPIAGNADLGTLFFLNAGAGWLGGSPGAILVTNSGGR